MAIWQFTFMIVRRENVESKTKKEIQMNLDGIYSWKGFLMNNESLEKLGITLEKEGSWSKNRKQYGKLDETCIELLYENNDLLEISCRLDVRSLTKAIIVNILEFIKENNSLILVDNNIYEPTLENINKLLKASSAVKFYENPEQFLSNLSKKI
ncbi:hypothetical protein HCA06_14380 [Listeria welshimeri]|nr:hypothetical protein [Listeria welshimeri]